MDIAFCVGNFPQLMRNLQTLLHRPAQAEIRSGPPAPIPGLVAWTQDVTRAKTMPQILLALGVLRWSNHFERAAEFAQVNEAAVPASWRTAWENEKAALAWYQGRRDEARAAWGSLEGSVPVLFNRALADLFGGQPAKGRAAFDQIIGQIPGRAPGTICRAFTCSSIFKTETLRLADSFCDCPLIP